MGLACVPQFLFASLLSIHIPYETFTQYRANFHVFIERFLELTHLHRGVRTVISLIYDTILESSIRPFLINIRNAGKAAKHGGSECVELVSLTQASNAYAIRKPLLILAAGVTNGAFRGND